MDAHGFTPPNSCGCVVGAVDCDPNKPVEGCVVCGLLKAENGDSPVGLDPKSEVVPIPEGWFPKIPDELEVPVNCVPVG